MRSHSIPLDGRPHTVSVDCRCGPDVEQIESWPGEVVAELVTHQPPRSPWYGDWRKASEPTV